MGATTGQATLAYVKKEASRGTLIEVAGTDVLRVIGDPEIAQDKVTADSLERINSLSITDVLSLRYNAGTFRLPFYMKRTGTVDTAVPSLDVILENAFGIKAVSGGTKITYSLLKLSTTLLNFSLFTRVGGMFLQAAGCFCKELALNFQATPDEAAVFRGEASGEFYQLYWAGETTITEDLTATAVGLDKFKVATADLSPSDGTASVAVKVAGKFTIGSYVTCGALTTAHKITAIDPSTGICTVTPAFGSNQASGSTVKGWVPTESEVGDPMSAHKGLATYGGANYTKLLQGGFRLVIPRRALVEEKNNSDYPTDDVLEGKRSVMLDTFRAYFDPTHTVPGDKFFSLADRLTQKAIVINIGDTGGYKWALNLPQSITQVPRLTGSGIVEINMQQKAVATAALDDECTLESL